MIHFKCSYLPVLLLLLFQTGCDHSTQPAESKSILTARTNADAPVASYVNGIWLTKNGTFTEQTFYSVNGLFQITEPSVVDTVINLRGAFVVPPFGDAHNHAFSDSYSIAFSQSLFLDQGFFYAMNLTNPYSGYLSVKDTVAQPQTIDVVYSHGGISAEKGTRPHPATVMERSYSYLSGGSDKKWPLEGDAYWFMESESEVKEKWPQLMKQDPNVVKVYIMRYGEDHQGLPECGYGLCPEELSMIMDSAQAAGKRVFAHVNTAKDLQLALDVGVDGIAHLPLGNDGLTMETAGPLILADSTIQQAGEMGITVTPTAHLLTEGFDPFPTDTLQEIIALQRDQMQKLKKAGVHIALGADGWREDPLREVMHLNAYNVFSNEELLRILSYETPKAIFPDRKIALFAEGYEASFVALECNPITEFSCVNNVNIAVKQGIIVKSD